jgi:branched-chain amino acid transport system substrate-binding protein
MQINESGGIDGSEVKIIHFDTKGDSQTGAEGYVKLRDVDEVIAIVGATYSGVSLEFKEMAMADNMPVISPSATHPDIPLNAPNIFRMCHSDIYQGQAAAKFAIDTLGASVPGVLYTQEDSYSETLANSFVAYNAQAGFDVAIQTYFYGDHDYTQQLSDIEKAGVDVLFLPHYSDIVGPILGQIKQMGLNITCIGGDGSDGIQHEFANEAQGFYFISQFAASDNLSFVEHYMLQFGEEPNFLSALAYDSVAALAQAIDLADSTNSDDVIMAIAANEIAGVTGTTSFDSDGNPVKEVAVIKIDNGNLTLGGKVSLGQ